MPTDIRNTTTSYFESGAIESQYTEVGGKIEGYKRRWYESGQLFSETEFKDGTPNGRIREWSAEGVLVLSAFMSQGEFNGSYQSWWDNGNPKESGEFLNGIRLPGYTWFQESGDVWKKLTE